MHTTKLWRDMAWIVSCRRIPLSLFLLTVLVEPLSADTCTWDGSTGLWSDTSKWSCSLVPDSDDDVIIGAGTVTLDASTTVANLTVAGGTLAGANTLIVSGTFTWNTGTISLDDGGPGADLTINGNSTWMGTRNLGANTRLLLNGKTNWTHGSLSGAAGSVVVNEDSLIQATDFNLIYGGDPVPRPRLINNAFFQFAIASSTTCNWFVENNGEFEVTLGTLQLFEGGSAASDFKALNGGSLAFQIGEFDLGAANFETDAASLIVFGAAATTDTLNGTISNAGKLRVAGGTITFAQANIGGTFEVAGGLAAFNQNTSVSGLNWTGGIIKTAPSFTLAVDGLSAWSGGPKTVAADTEIELNDKTTWTAGNITGFSNSVITNNDSLLQQTDFQMLPSGSPSPFPRVDNQGYYSYAFGTGATFDFNFDNAGKLAVQQSSFQLNRGGTNTGQILVSSGAQLTIANSAFTNAASGSIGGIGTVGLTGAGVNFTNQGTFAPGMSTGIMNFTGNYPNSTLEIEIVSGAGEGTGHDQLRVTGNAALSGTASVLLDPGFTPPPGQQFNVLTCTGTCSGDFTTITSNNPEIAFINVVGTQTVLLQVISTALPVELAGFDAVVEDLDVVLSWMTESETDNAGFELQRFKGISDTAPEKDELWEALTWIEGAGTTADPQSYSFRLTDVDPGRHRFRLKQLDFDGAFEYSPEVEVAVGVPGTHLLIPAYPNPFNPQAVIRLAVSREQRVSIDVYDVAGRNVARLFDGVMPADVTRQFRVDGSAWSSGIYLYRVVGETFVETKQMALIR